MTPEERYLEQAIDRYSPEIASIARAALKILRKRYPGARQLVYDRRGSLPIGFASAHGGGGVFSVVLYPRWVRFFFLEGAGLEDPEERLEGTGNQVRSIRLDTGAKILNEPYLRALITAAVKASGRDLKQGDGAVVLKSAV